MCHVYLRLTLLYFLFYKMTLPFDRFVESIEELAEQAHSVVTTQRYVAQDHGTAATTEHGHVPETWGSSNITNMDIWRWNAQS